MTTWYVSDTHFRHANIIRYCNRPFTSVQEMDAEMIRRWNAKVQPEDFVWHLGDFCLGSLDQIKAVLDQLNGHVGLILGNHDRHSTAAYRSLGFDQASGRALGRETQGHKICLSHRDTDLEPQEDFVLFGHEHGRALRKPHHYEISVELTDYAPVTLEEIANIYGVTSLKRYGK